MINACRKLVGIVLPTIAAFAMVAILGAPASRADAWSETFANCELQTVKGAALSIEAYACGEEQGNVHLEADDSLPGFVIVSDGPDGISRNVAIRVFKKEPGAPFSAILEDVKALSPGPHTNTCVFEKWPGEEAGVMRYVLAPTGDAKAAWDKGLENGEPVDPPCGALGVQFVGDLYFEEIAGDPGTVAFVDSGSEIQIFKPQTLKSASQ